MKDKEIQEQESFKLQLKNKKRIQELKEKGITLIALVVTIIILLILAGVALNMAMNGDGLFSRARNAADKYKKAQKEEGDLLLETEYEMAKLQGTIDNTETLGEYLMEKEIKEKYGVDLKIGDTVEYDDQIESYSGTWKVLGIEDGKILLMSSNAVENARISGPEAYQNAEETLNNICEIYGGGTGAESARCLKVEDINRITGYNPENPKNGGKYCKDTVMEYGNTIECKLQNNIVTYTGSNGKTLKAEYTSFLKPDGTELKTDGSEVFQYVSYTYTYFVNSAYTGSGRDANEIDIDVSDTRWKSLFHTNTNGYWLNNKMFYLNSEGKLAYGMRALTRNYGNKVSSRVCYVGFYGVFRADGTDCNETKFVNCVVVLNDSVKFSKVNESLWNIEYNE